MIGFYTLQVSQYTGKTFRWVMVNDPDYVLSGVKHLHHMHIKKGEPGYFYCPVKTHKTYDLPVTMRFREFVKTPYRQVELDKAVKHTKDRQEKREVVAAKREGKGWKKPGNPDGCMYKF